MSLNAGLVQVHDTMPGSEIIVKTRQVRNFVL